MNFTNYFESQTINSLELSERKKIKKKTRETASEKKKYALISFVFYWSVLPRLQKH